MVTYIEGLRNVVSVYMNHFRTYFTQKVGLRLSALRKVRTVRSDIFQNYYIQWLIEVR